MSDDYYNVLGIARSATPAEIKRAYRTQARKWHLDKNPDNKEEAEKKFKLIAEAYEVLSDEEKRLAYDRYGKEGLGPSSGGNTFHSGAGQFKRVRRGFQDPYHLFAEHFGKTEADKFFGDDFFRTGSTEKLFRNGSTDNLSAHSGANSSNAPSFWNRFISCCRSFFSPTLTSTTFTPISTTFTPTTTTSTEITNIFGKRVRTTKVVKNGTETVTVTEDGLVTSRKVNGVETVESNSQRRRSSPCILS